MAANIIKLVEKLSTARVAERQALEAVEAALHEVDAGSVYTIDGVPMQVVDRNIGTKEAPNVVRKLIPALSARQLAIMRGETVPPLGKQGRPRAGSKPTS